MKNYLFDLYGTLADVRTDENSPLFKEKYSKYFRKIAPDIDFWQSFKKECESLTFKDEYCEPDVFKIFKAVAPATDERRLKKAAYVFRRYSRSRLCLYKGAKKLLSQLKRRGAKVYLVSNAQSCFTLPELKKLKIYDLFDGIELSSDFGKKKPCKAFFVHVLNKYGLNAKDCIFCGNDYKSDILGAKSANLSAAYVKTAISPADDDLDEVKSIADFATCNYKNFITYLLDICG